MMTSCSPGWIKFVEQFYPDLIPNLSTCKSPQQMLGAVVKTFLAERLGVDPDRIYSVAIMPCTAKKFEAGRPEMGREGRQDIDAVLTTRELAELIRMHGLDLAALPPDAADTPFGERTSAGKLFGASGGVAEAAIRTAHFLLTGQHARSAQGAGAARPRRHQGVPDDGGRPRDRRRGGRRASATRASSSSRSAPGRTDLQFIEVMSCAGGCVAGGGQPRSASPDAVRARMQALYVIDRDAAVRASHQNPAIQRLYAEFLEKPLSHKSHELLHTHYERREPVM